MFSTTKKTSGKAHGFSLLEVMLSLILIGLLISGFLTGYQVYMAEKKETKADKTYDSVRSAMSAYITENTGASLRARYPCPARLDRGPDNTQYGQERRNADGTCIASVDGSNGIFDAGDVYIGALPAKTLGLSADMMLDVHGNKLTYAITKSHTLDNALMAAPDGKVKVLDEAGASFVMAPFALISHGQDGAGAYGIEGGIVLPCRDGAAADGENCDFDDATFKESRVKLGNSATFYDDRLAFSLADDDDDEWWSAFDDDPNHIHNRNPGIVCVGAGCDHADSVLGDALLANGNVRVLDDLFVVDLVSAGGDVMAGGHVLSDGDVWARNNVEADNNVTADRDIEAGRDVTAGRNISATQDIAADRDLTAGRNATVANNLTVDSNISGGNNITATNNVTAGRDLTAGRNIDAGQDVTAARDLTAGRHASVAGNITIDGNILAGGTVKIGDTPPDGVLGIDGNVRIVNGYLAIDSDGDTSWGSIFNIPGNGSDGLVISAKIPSHNQLDIVIHEEGRVGIGGITDPKVALDVGGAVRVGEHLDACNSSKEGAMRFNAEKKNIEFCSENEWKLISSVANSCIRRRSAPFDDDFVVWCPEEHPDLYSCSQLDDQAPNNAFELGPYCPTDGVCLMKDGSRARGNLGGAGIYYERVVKNTGGGNYAEGCVIYDEGHSHTPHRGEIMCCERAKD